MTQDELNTLMRLLDDPDEFVYKSVESKILESGVDVIPMLQNVISEPSTSSNTVLQLRIAEIIKNLENDSLINSVNIWKQDEYNDLKKIAWLISRIQNFNLSYQDFLKNMAVIKDNIPSYDMNNFTSLEKIKILNYTFFRKLKFSHVLHSDYYNPDACFPNNVLETRKGNAVSLAILYIIVASELGINIGPVNLPKNLILGYMDFKTNAKLYINPVTNGLIFERTEIDRFLKEINLPPQMQFYECCSNAILADRLILRLIRSYKIKKKNLNATETERLKLSKKIHSTIGQLTINGPIEWE